MDRLMPIQALGLKSGQCLLRDFNLLSKLALDDNVNGRMEGDVRKICVQPSVVGLDQLDPLGLIERQPLFRFRCGLESYFITPGAPLSSRHAARASPFVVLTLHRHSGGRPGYRACRRAAAYPRERIERIRP